jgi:ATP-binding cassette subfamily B protein
MWRIYFIYYRFLLRYKLRLAVFMVVLIAYSIANSIQPYFYKLFIDLIPSSDWQKLFKLLLVFVGVRLIKLAVDNLTYLTGDWVVIAAARDARMTVFKKIQDLDFAYHLSKSTGSLISAIKRGDNAFFDMHHSINIETARVIFGFLVMMYFFQRMSPLISIIMVGTIAVNIVLSYFLIRNNIGSRTKFNQSEDEVSDIIVDNLINYETVKLFAKEGQELVRLGNKFRQWFRALWGYANSFRMIDLTIGVTGNVSLFLVMLVGLGQLSRAQISVGDYIMIFAFMMNFYPQFFELVYNFRNVAKHQTDINKYFSILNEETRVKDPQLPLKKTSVEGEIEFKGVDFGYPEGKEGAIKNLNLIIRQGQSIALVGHSGAGKTTLVKLLMRFYDPDKGQILIDGVDIKKFSKSGLRNLMGVVPQEPILFNNTIGYNIAYGAKRPSKQEIIASAKMANLDDFIKSLPKKYETQVGERGVKLSGGQKQRLAIARMILSDPDIIIFDEATSQLDSESEKKIQQAFWKAAENKTTIIIAHRLSTVARADKIAVMKDGRIVEIGSHRELLLKANSLYTKFWRLQTIN